MAKLSHKLIYEALTMLDRVMGTSELLLSVAPIRIMVAGGAVAVMHLNTREATEDFDFILDPNVDVDEEYREEFFQCAKMVPTIVSGLPKAWLNDHMRVFIRADKRQELFLTSVQQDIILFKGDNLVAYASRHDWALETKLARIESLDEGNDKRDTDISDCVELVRLMNNSTNASASASAGTNADANANRRVTAQYLRGLNFNGYKVQTFENAIAAVAEAYKEKYGQDGILF